MVNTIKRLFLTYFCRIYGYFRHNLPQMRKNRAKTKQINAILDEFGALPYQRDIVIAYLTQGKHKNSRDL